MRKPSMPLSLVQGKHLTKKEKEVRGEAEAGLVTGEPLQCWKETKDNPIAYKHYVRLARLFKIIGKHDALIENVLNRYCVLLADCADAEKEDARLHRMADRLEERSGDMDFSDYIRQALQVEKAIGMNQARLNTKRKMLLDIERENLMTLAAQMRSIPKKPKEEAAPSGVAAFSKRREG